MEYVGVVTGDVVSSTSAKDPGRVQETLARVLDDVSKANRSRMVQDFAVYRGDGFQGVTTPEGAFRVALNIRMSLLAEFRNWGGKRLDVRIGVGVGRADPLGKHPGQGHGEAFLLSGKTLDALSAKSSEKRRLVVRTPWEPFNRTMVPQCALVDALASGWTDRQSRAAELGLDGRTQERIGEMMGIRQSTASAHLTASGLWAVKESIAYYEESIRSLLAGGDLAHE